MDTRNKEEITEILSKIENLRVAQAIYQNYSSTFNYLVNKYFNPKMEEFAKQKGLEYGYRGCDESYVEFNFTNSNSQGKYWIGYFFDVYR